MCDWTGVCVKVHKPTCGCVCVCLCIYCMNLHVYTVCVLWGCVSHPRRALVSGVRGGHGHRAAASLGRAGALEHAGMEACVSPCVFSQVVAPHEALVAHRAVEALLARVCAVVTRQLVWARELLAAVRPGTLEGALTWRDTHTQVLYYYSSEGCPLTGFKALPRSYISTYLVLMRSEKRGEKSFEGDLLLIL